MKIYSSREFSRSTGQVQKAHTAPVPITNRGKSDLVLMSHAEYARLAAGQTVKSMLDALTPAADLAAEMADIEFEIRPRSRAQRRPAEFE